MHTNPYAYRCVHVYVQDYIYICKQNVYVPVIKCMYVQVYVYTFNDMCIYINKYIYIYIQIYIYIYTNVVSFLYKERPLTCKLSCMLVNISYNRVNICYIFSIYVGRYI